MGWMSCEHRQHLSILSLWNRILKLPDDRLTKKIIISDYYLVHYLAQSGHKKNGVGMFLKCLKNTLNPLFTRENQLILKTLKSVSWHNSYLEYYQ